MNRKRYTKEQLSRILGEHEAETLRPGGAWRWNVTRAGRYPRCCVNQVVFNEYDEHDAMFSHGSVARSTALWFDRSYDPDLTSDELLHWLERSSDH